MPPVKSSTRASSGAAVAVAEPYSLPSPPTSASSSASSSTHMAGLNKAAQALYTKMITSNEEGHIYTQTELSELAGVSDPVKLMLLIQEHMNLGLVKMLRQGDDLCYQAVKKEDAEKVQSMTKDEAMVYSYIEASGSEGIWTKTIKAKTNLHQSVVQRCLKNLEGKRYIKNIKSVKYPTRKIYMLYNLQPSIDVTGGPWFTDSELDSEFISSLLSIVFRFIASESLPSEDDKPIAPPPKHRKRKSSSKKLSSSSKEKQVSYDQLSFPASYSKYPSLSDIHDFVQNSGITTVDLALSDIKALVDVLIYDGKIETIDDGMSYRAVLGATAENGADLGGDEDGSGGVAWDAFTEVPCGHCSIVDLCKTGGPVSAEECVYFDEWLIQ